MDRIELIQDVVVFDVAIDQPRSAVLVDVYGGMANICGSVQFLMPDERERTTAVRVLEAWRQDETRLTLVARGTSVALQNDHAVFGSQMGPAAARPPS